MTQPPQVIIGLTTEVLAAPWYEGRRRYQLFTDYSECLRRAGGIPVLIPGDTPAGDLPALLQGMHGVIATGGDDMDLRRLDRDHPAPTPECKPVPAEQQEMNLALLQAVLDRDMPLLGVCFGMQILGLLKNTGFIQHLDRHAEHTKGIQHLIHPRPSSQLAEVLGTAPVSVPSFHHQAVAESPSSDLSISATAEDGTIEAIEVPGRKFALGVQWHPERAPDSPASLAIFSRFVSAADAYRKATT